MATATTPLRFGLVALPRDAASWRETSRRVERLGFDSLLVPDNLHATGATLACTAAATATTTLTVGPYVVATPLRTPGLVAAEAAGLHQLAGGRVEFGVGAGRPDAAEEARQLGLDFGTPVARIAHLERTIEAVRERTPEVRITVAASGPRTLALAGRTADVVALGASPYASVDELARMADAVLGAAGDRADSVLLNLNLSAVGDEVPLWMAQKMGITVQRLVEADSASYLRGSPDDMAQTLVDRRERTGISYVCAGVDHAEDLAPVVELLRHDFGGQKVTWTSPSDPEAGAGGGRLRR
jgi:alkanesulfonate monooxygenase SsuD/methylene tetrahydromethanopterin reductase-like flavin-dependent oxidoreductase (luciferase family)